MKRRNSHLTLFLVVLLFSLLIVSYAQGVSPTGTEGGYFGKVIDPNKYILGPGDRIRVFIIMENNQSETLDLIVSSTGNVLLPLAGSLKILNMSLTEASREITRQLMKFYPKSNIQVDLISPRSMKIMITGEVTSPGTYLISAVSTLDEAIKVAGGLKSSASSRRVLIKRKDKNIEIDYLRFLKYGDMEQNPYLEEGDAIYVPLMGKSVKIAGQVKNPGMYEIKEGERLKDLIDMAGGLTNTASLYGAILDRVDGKRMELNLYNLIYGKEKEKEEANILLQAGDTITVLTEIKRIQVLGFVRNPGPIQIVEEPKITAEGTEVLGESIMGAKISELIRKAGGVLPNGSTRSIEVRRRGNPENKVVVDLYRVLVLGEESEQDINVFPGDVIYVPPIVKSVKVLGEVKDPGMYEIKEGEKLKDLVDIAGGVTAFADLLGCTLERRISEKREIYNIDLGKLIYDNDESVNIPLKNGDTLNIPTKADKIYVSGYVVKPQVFTIAKGSEVGEGIKISELISKVGGILPQGSQRRIRVVRDGKVIKEVDLFNVLTKGQIEEENIQLLPGDIVYVPLAEKVVKILGEVKAPGTYEVKSGEKIKDLIELAGGFTVRADLSNIVLERFITEKKQTFNLDLTKLYKSGDESVNIELEDGDVVNIPIRIE
ncbi:MAG TPA: SLBB domain-containing protein [Dictyoglomaceae bacterium]|nr:SLBB domain-containing protein [Dictyoglomaceae bacterium]